MNAMGRFIGGGLRTVLAVKWTVVACSLALLVLLLGKGWSGWVLTRIGGRFWSANILKWFTKGLTVVGPPDGVWPKRAIYVANHSSYLDVNAIFASIPHPVIFLSKASVRKVPFLGWANARVGTVFVERGKLDSAIRAAQDLNHALDEGKVVCVFPEGTRSSDGKLLPFKKGAFRLALDAGVPVVPFGIQGAREALPKGNFLIQKRPITIRFGAPISVEKYREANDLEGLSAAARNAIMGLMN